MLCSLSHALDLNNETEQERCKMNMLHARTGHDHDKELVWNKHATNVYESFCKPLNKTKCWKTSTLRMYMTRSLSHGTRAQKFKSEMITCFKGRLSVKLKRLILIWIHTKVGWSSRYWTNSVRNSISKYLFPFLFSSWWRSALNRQFPFPSLSTIFNPLAAAFLSKSVNKVCLLLLTGWWCNCCKLHKACFAKKRRKKAFLISLFQTIGRREWMFYELSESMSHESTDRMSGFW